MVRLGGPRQGPRNEAADIGAFQAERDACPHLPHVGLHKI
jgi:hypothetical protein